MPGWDKEADKLQADIDARLVPEFARPRPKQSPAPKGPKDATKRIYLGAASDSAPVFITERIALEHLHLIGATGSGKTNELESLARQIIADNGRGLLLLDPNGSHPDGLFRRLVAFCEARKIGERRPVHVVDPNVTTHAFGFNPLALAPDTDVSVIAHAALEAVERVWDEDTHAKPTIRTLLTACFMACAENGLTLADVPVIFEAATGGDMRRSLITGSAIRTVRAELERLDELADDPKLKREFLAETRGPLNRLNDFLTSSALATILGQTTRTLDLAKAMDEGHVILVNLQPGQQLSENAARVLGAILLRYAFLATLRRRNYHTPFFVMADEAHDILTGDLGKLLPQARKFGVSVILAHQYLHQLRDRGETVYNAVRATARVKLVFGLSHQDEAEDLARDVIPLDLEEAKSSMVRPTVVGQQRIWLENASKGANTSEGQSSAQSASETHSLAATTTETNATFDAAGFADGLISSQVLSPELGWLDMPQVLSLTAGKSEARSNSQGASRATGQAFTEGFARALAHAKAQHRTTGTSEGHGVSEALESVYKELPTALFSKDEQQYRAGRILRQLSPGAAYIAFRDKASLVMTPQMKPLLMTDDELRKLHAGSVARSPSVKSAGDAAREIAERLQRFRPLEPETPAQREPDEDFAAPEPAPPSPSLLDDPAAFARGFWNRLMKKDKNEPPKPPAQPPRRGDKPKLVVDNDNEPPKKPDGPKR